MPCICIRKCYTLSMENQADLDNQKSQLTDQNPTSQPVHVAEKRKISYWIIPIVALTVILIVAGLVVFSMVKQSVEKSSTVQQTPDAQTIIPSQQKPAADLATYKILLNYEEKISDNTYTNGIYLLDPNNPPPKKILDNPDYQTENNSQFINLKFTTDGKYLGWIRA